MQEASAASTSSAGQRIDVGELVREVSELLAADQPLAQSVTQLCTLLAHAFGARSVTIHLDDADRSRSEYRYDLPLGLVGEERNIPKETIPLQIGTHSIGIMTIVHRKPLTPQDAATLETCARYIAVGLRNARLTNVNGNLERLIEVDALTEVGNRRRFDLAIDSEWRRCARHGEPISVVMIDVDYFKEYNDRYGHVAGDACLRRIARTIAGSTMRASDIVTRYGGEEFAIILSETDLAGSVAVAEKIRLAVERMHIPHASTSLGAVSISAGIATAMPKQGEDVATLIESADLALYRAKTSGRNRIVAGTYVSEGSIVERRGAAPNVNLPIPLTTFLGRRSEIAQIDQLLGATRMLTLVGPGGVGKTRLVLEIAALRAQQQAVTFVDLAPAVGPADVPPAMFAALGLRDDLGRSIEEMIAEHFERLGGLLILDNCEHVLAECARLTEVLLRAAAGVTIVATSREPLGVRGESLYRISTLDVPLAGRPLTAKEALEFDAVRLFVDRAKLVDLSFELTDDNADNVARICRRLDGIPLAIELAAPRLRMMTLEQIESGLDARFRLLTGGSRTALPRQRTLHALIRWGYDLLSPAEQLALQRLSTLVGAWTIEAATAIVSCSEIDPLDVLDLVASLVDKSLLLAEPHDGEMRYRALESTRAFGNECLEASGTHYAAAQAHAEYFSALVKTALAAPNRDDARAFAAIRREYDNIQAALHWSLNSNDAYGLGLDLVEICWPFWEGSGFYRDARRWIERALRLDIEESRRRRLSVRLTKAIMNVGNARATLEHALPMIEICSKAEDWHGLHLVRRMAASAYFELNELARAREQIRYMLGEPCVGTEERALTLGYLACIETSEGNIEESLRLSEEASKLNVSSSLRSWINQYRALALFLAGETDQAIEFGQASLTYEESVHNRLRSALVSVTLAWCWLVKGELGRARNALRSALREQSLVTRAELYCKCLEGFALLAEARGEPARAATLLGFAEAEHRRRGVDSRYERIATLLEDGRQRLEATMGRPNLDAARARGAWLSGEAAATEALAI